LEQSLSIVVLESWSWSPGAPRNSLRTVLLMDVRIAVLVLVLVLRTAVLVFVVAAAVLVLS